MDEWEHIEQQKNLKDILNKYMLKVRLRQLRDVKYVLDNNNNNYVSNSNLDTPLLESNKHNKHNKKKSLSRYCCCFNIKHFY